ncbi:hypothetical protein ACFOKI_04465 [Sphingomonas qilianensis]|uniref:SPOR domain-containing protein n=1 Tax=Sphingomonas qilianensis TaxID=1736690 RepID=A0ABU9XUE7_9SPHN
MAKHTKHPRPADTSATDTRADARGASPRPARSRGATALSIGAVVLTIGAAVAGFLSRRRIADLVAPGSAEHQAPDLALDQPHNDGSVRAPVDFRPDMDAPMSAAEREALRPATGPAPSLVADRGEMNSQTGADN